MNHKTIFRAVAEIQETNFGVTLRYGESIGDALVLAPIEYTLPSNVKVVSHTIGAKTLLTVREDILAQITKEFIETIRWMRRSKEGESGISTSRSINQIDTSDRKEKQEDARNTEGR